MDSFGPLVSTQWLGDHLGADDLKIIDGSWRLPGAGDARDDYSQRHIQGAVFLDIDAISDRRSELPHMLPPPDMFERAAGGLGISNSSRIVVYDDHGIFSAPRVWWTFRVMGHETVAVLDGGLKKWLAEGRCVTDDATTPAAAYYEATPLDAAAANADDIRTAMTSAAATIIDARPAARFEGAAAEPRPGLRSGHIPGAQNLPFASLINDDATLRPTAELAALFENAGVSTTTAVVATCGSGITAAILLLALEQVGHRSHSLYDGSWSEWGDQRRAEQDYPVATGKP